MKFVVMSGAICLVVGFFAGMQVKNFEENQSSELKDAGGNSERRILAGDRSGRGGGRIADRESLGRAGANRKAEIEEALRLGDSEEVIRLIRDSMEKENYFGRRIPSVCDALSLMNEDNAAVMKAAFDQSWAAGYDFYWGRALFIDRYAEIVGFQAVEEYPAGKPLHRAIGGWARKDRDGAIDWVNQLEDGRMKNDSIDALMRSVAKEDPSYGLEVFRAFPEREQAQRLDS